MHQTSQNVVATLNSVFNLVVGTDDSSFALDCTLHRDT